MTTQERKNRIVARGEQSLHSHIIVGDAIVRNSNGEILIEITGKASIRHLLEDAWMNGQEVHTGEHADIDLTDMPNQVRHGDTFLEKVGERTYKFTQQTEYDPYNDVIRQTRD